METKCCSNGIGKEVIFHITYTFSPESVEDMRESDPDFPLQTKDIVCPFCLAEKINAKEVGITINGITTSIGEDFSM